MSGNSLSLCLDSYGVPLCRHRRQLQPSSALPRSLQSPHPAQGQLPHPAPRTGAASKPKQEPRAPSKPASSLTAMTAQRWATGRNPSTALARQGRPSSPAATVVQVVGPVKVAAPLRVVQRGARAAMRWRRCAAAMETTIASTCRTRMAWTAPIAQRRTCTLTTEPRCGAEQELLYKRGTRWRETSR